MRNRLVPGSNPGRPTLPILKEKWDDLIYSIYLRILPTEPGHWLSINYLPEHEPGKRGRYYFKENKIEVYIFSFLRESDIEQELAHITIHELCHWANDCRCAGEDHTTSWSRVINRELRYIDEDQ